jgi:hypothetical protein
LENPAEILSNQNEWPASEFDQIKDLAIPKWETVIPDDK